MTEEDVFEIATVQERIGTEIKQTTAIQNYKEKSENVKDFPLVRSHLQTSRNKEEKYCNTGHKTAIRILK